MVVSNNKVRVSSHGDWLGPGMYMCVSVRTCVHVHEKLTSS